MNIILRGKNVVVIVVVLLLFRALTFIRILFEQVLTNEPDLSKCVTTAYEGSLKKYHGWMVQKVFGVSCNLFFRSVCPNFGVFH